MKFATTVQIGCSLIVAIFSIIVGFVGLNETIIGYISFVNHNYGILYGGEPVVVQVASGQLSGFLSSSTGSGYSSRGGRSFYEFLGVPFAEPPVGELRFKPPKKVEPWSGVRDASGYGSKCWQFDPFIHVLSGDEDCLYLNVFTPKLPNALESSPGKLPVLVFIHGGLFMFGRAEMFRPEYFMDEDVVLVEIHYRLGAFGFLNLGSADAPGNMGLKDQVMALRWVQENIAAFGGDPSRVTLVGESAGGASIHMHMLSPMSRGLFHKAITMSGTALNNWATQPKPKEQVEMVAERLACPSNCTKALTDCLQHTEARRLAELSEDIVDFLHHRLMAFAPTVETPGGEGAFLTDTPRNLITSNRVLTRVPWITGVNSDEGLIYAVGILLNSTCSRILNSDYMKWAPTLFDYEDVPESRKEAISSAIHSYYMKGENFTLDTLEPAVRMWSDASFYRGIEETARLHPRVGEAPLYLYHYSYQARNALAQVYLNMAGWLPVAFDGILTNFVRQIKNDFLEWPERQYGASHADELSMLFQYPRVLGVIGVDHKDFEFSRSLVRLWASFAQSKDGKPSMEGLEWPSVLPGPGASLPFLELNKNPRIVKDPFKERVKFWKGLGIDPKPPGPLKVEPR